MLKTSFICKIPFLCAEQAPTGVLSDSSEDFMIISGVNHKETNRAIYGSLAIVGLDRLFAIGGLHDTNYTGSAEYYMGDKEEVSKYLYAYMIARNCTGKQFCFEPASTGKYSIKLSDIFIFVERMYIDPVTQIGGDVSEIINPYITHYAPISMKNVLS